ncbi:MAG: CinA family protein, partial [Bdellovibrionales bacterium]|nr:CinA family protein [Bdellovibrionales bacterium]
MNSNVLVSNITELLRNRNETLSLAESCTGGLISAEIVRRPGVSDVYLGAVVSYADSLKAQVLGVNSKSLEEFGAVSREVAIEMAQGARVALNSNWSIAVTGVAGPTGGTAEKPVGTVWISVIGPEYLDTQVYKFDGDREMVQNQTLVQALKNLSLA